MTTNNVLTEEFYKNLYDEICDNSDFGIDNEDASETTCEMEFQIGNVFVRLNATFEVEFVDDSFDHAFGTEHCHHYEVGELTDIEVEDVYLTDENDNETEITEQFDDDKFWGQFIQKGVGNIKPGDEVLARIAGRYGREVKAIYQYTDTRTNHHFCKISWQTIECSWIRLPNESKKF